MARLTQTPATPGVGTDAAGNPASANLDLTRWGIGSVNRPAVTIADFYRAVAEDQR